MLQDGSYVMLHTESTLFNNIKYSKLTKSILAKNLILIKILGVKV